MLSQTPLTAEVSAFLNALFQKEDLVELRCIETWEENGKKKQDYGYGCLWKIFLRAPNQ
jgi:hypothetical protein